MGEKSRPRGALVVLQGGEVGRRYLLPESGALEVGRHAACQVRLDDLSVSARHCRIEIGEDRVEVIDLESKNGTRVNGVPVARRVVRSRDRVRVGHAVLQFEGAFSSPRVSIVDDGRAAGAPQTYSVAATVDGTIVANRGVGATGEEDVYLAWQILYEFATVSARTQDPSEVIQSCLESVVDSVGADRACLVLESKDGKGLDVGFVVERGAGEPFLVSRTIARNAIDKGQSVLTLDRAATELFHDSKSLMDQGVQSVMCVPLQTDSGRRGALYVDSLHQAGAFRPETLRALTGLSRLVGLTLDKLILSEQVREAERQLAAIDANAPVAIICLDKERRISRWSDHAARLFGRSAEEVLGKMRLEDIFQSQAVCQQILSRVSRKGFYEGEFAATSKGEHTIAVFARFVQLDQPEGGAYQVAGYLVDVTERNRLLSHVVQHEKMAGLGLILAGVSHDLGKMVGQIHSQCELHSAGEVDPEGMQRIGEFADQALDLLRNLMDFARRSTHKELADPMTLVESVRKMTATDLRISKVKVDTDFQPCRPVRVNVSFMKDVLLNLILNARQAMPSGGRTRLGGRERGRVVEIRIEDSGVGIPPDRLDCLFEPFYTQRAAKDPERGTGLGLFMVKQVVEEHAGRIRVESKVGVGTTFFVELPVAAAEESGRKGPERTRDPLADTQVD